MKTYKVTITEKLEMSVEVEAANRRVAEKFVEECWSDGDYILDAGNFKGVTFKAEPPQRERGYER